MQNTGAWKPTKFERAKVGWRAAQSIAPASRLITNLVCRSYVAAIERFARGSLVDLGCGTVPLYGAYLPLVSDVTCVDWPGSLHEVSHVDEFIDLNEPLPFADQSFDTILSTDVLEHIWNHAMFWSEMSRVLRPDGHIILGTPFFYWLHEEPHDYFRWTRHALQRACTDVGLQAVAVTPYGGPLDIIADLLLKTISLKSQSISRFLYMPIWTAIQGGPLRNFSDAASHRLPMGYCMIASKRSLRFS
jgi:SAM-dependent methyltransferase